MNGFFKDLKQFPSQNGKRDGTGRKTLETEQNGTPEILEQKCKTINLK